MFLYTKYFLVFLSIFILPIRAMVTSKRRDLLGFFISSQQSLLKEPITEAEKEQLANIKNLLQEGLDYNPSLFKIGLQEKSIMCAAVEYNDLELLELLLKHGVDINACDNYGHNALYRSISMNNGVLREYLLQKGANPNLPSWPITPLELAMLNKDASAIKSLIRCGANIDVGTANKFVGDAYTNFNLKKEYYSDIKTVLLLLNNNKCNALRFLILSYLPEYHCHPGLYKELQNRRYRLKPFALHVVDRHTEIIQEILEVKNKNNKNILELHSSITELNEKLLKDTTEFKRKYPNTLLLKQGNLAFELLKRYASKYESLVPNNILNPQESAVLCLDISLQDPVTFHISQQ